MEIITFVIGIVLGIIGLLTFSKKRGATQDVKEDIAGASDTLNFAIMREFLERNKRN